MLPNPVPKLAVALGLHCPNAAGLHKHGSTSAAAVAPNLHRGLRGRSLGFVSPLGQAIGPALGCPAPAVRIHRLQFIRKRKRFPIIYEHSHGVFLCHSRVFDQIIAWSPDGVRALVQPAVAPRWRCLWTAFRSIRAGDQAGLTPAGTSPQCRPWWQTPARPRILPRTPPPRR